MHEMSIAQNILEIVQDTMSREQGGKLREVAVQVGELVAVVPESLEFCFNVLVENTEWHGTRLKIEVLPVAADCRECRNRFHVEKFLFICPRCTSSDLNIVQGQELIIRHLEVE
jgi:hydrogenase nickel incorporation protein HypA/HybF